MDFANSAKSMRTLQVKRFDEILPTHNLMKSSFIISVFTTILLLGFSCNAGPAREAGPTRQVASQPSWCIEKGYDDIVTTKADSLKFYSIAGKLNEVEFESKNLSELFLIAAKAFIGTSYVSNTLEVNDVEKLVVNIQGVDCVTLVEYALAIALSVRQGDGNFEDFARFLTCLRYRSGIIDGYPSRLHYFTEWLFEKQEAGLLEMVNNMPGSQPHNSKVRFMTSRPHLYKQLQNEVYLSKMAEIEENIATIEMNYIPKEKLQSVEDQINDGYILAFVTSIVGLDVSHTGIALRKNDRLFLLHASTKSNQVEISPVPLVEYINPSRNVIGILVGRLLD